MKSDEKKELPQRLLIIGMTAAIFGFLYLSSRYSYLLFHSIAEIFSIVVAFGIFTLAWNSRRFLDNNALLFIGIAYLFVGLVNVLHMLAYKGMGVFPGYDANLPTQLWVAGQYVQSYIPAHRVRLRRQAAEPGSHDCCLQRVNNRAHPVYIRLAGVPGLLRGRCGPDDLQESERISVRRAVFRIPLLIAS
jgi:hypothetical protein